MDNSFVKAAMSYFGLVETSAQVADVLFEAGQIVLTVRVPLSDVDMMGILDRMKTMREQAPEPEPIYVKTGVVSDERMRDEYNGMDKHSKSEFGSFTRYKAWRLGVAMDATIAGEVELPAHVYLSPAEATPQQKAMAIGRDERGNYAIAVEDLTNDQYAQAIRDGRITGPKSEGADQLRADQQREMDVHLADGASESLNPEQVRLATIESMKADQLRAEYVQRTMDAHARLNGADGMPTSNADDFGGLPG